MAFDGVYDKSDKKQSATGTGRNMPNETVQNREVGVHIQNYDMKHKSNLFIFLMTMLLGFSMFTSCEKEKCDVAVEPVDIKTEIHDYERTIIVRFKVPKENGDTRVVITGKIIGYHENDDGELPNPEIKAFTVSKTGVSGHFQNNIQGTGEPVPGAEVIVEQEPNEDPVTMVTSDADNGSFTIDRKFPPGTYQVRIAASPANHSKGGFAIGGFNAT